MFQIKKYKDKFGREYELVYYDPEDFAADERRDGFLIPPKEFGKSKVYALVLTYDSDDYLPYCRKALANQVDKIYELCMAGTDLSKIANKCLSMIPKNSWVFYVNPDEILFDLPDGYIKALAHWLESKEIMCGDVRFPDFVYNYGTLFAHFDWGEGAGNYWTARRLFKWTGEEKFIHKTHFNISNTKPCMASVMKGYENNNEHTGEWAGTVVKLHDVRLFHYGKLRGIERQRSKGERLTDGELMAKGLLATIPYKGPHPSVMNLG